MEQNMENKVMADIKELFKKQKAIIAPESVQIEITEYCNNNCVHCYNHWRGVWVKERNKFALTKERVNHIDAVAE